MTEDKAKTLLAEDPSLTPVRLGGRSLLLRRPTRAVWEDFTTKIEDPVGRIRAMSRLVRDCVVHPEGDALDAFLDERPARTMHLAGVIGKLAGADEEIEVGNL